MWFKNRKNKIKQKETPEVGQVKVTNSDFSFNEYESLKYNQFLTDDKHYNEAQKVIPVKVNTFNHIQDSSINGKLEKREIRDEITFQKINSKLNFDVDLAVNSGIILPEVAEQIMNNGQQHTYSSKSEFQMSNETKAFLSKQQTMLLDLDDINTIVNDANEITKEIKFGIEKEINQVKNINELPSIESVRAERSMLPEEERIRQQEIAFNAINFDVDTPANETPEAPKETYIKRDYTTIDYTKLVPVDAKPLNSRISKEEKRKV
ncbi:MAG: hypothetical protein ACRC42_04445 [Mycoplasma sp.]